MSEFILKTKAQFDLMSQAEQNQYGSQLLSLVNSFSEAEKEVFTNAIIVGQVGVDSYLETVNSVISDPFYKVQFQPTDSQQARVDRGVLNILSASIGASGGAGDIFNYIFTLIASFQKNNKEGVYNTIIAQQVNQILQDLPSDGPFYQIRRAINASQDVTGAYNILASPTQELLGIARSDGAKATEVAQQLLDITSSLIALNQYINSTSKVFPILSALNNMEVLRNTIVTPSDINQRAALHAAAMVRFNTILADSQSILPAFDSLNLLTVPQISRYTDVSNIIGELNNIKAKLLLIKPAILELNQALTAFMAKPIDNFTKTFRVEEYTAFQALRDNVHITISAAFASAQGSVKNTEGQCQKAVSEDIKARQDRAQDSFANINNITSSSNALSADSPYNVLFTAPYLGDITMMHLAWGSLLLGLAGGQYCMYKILSFWS